MHYSVFKVKHYDRLCLAGVGEGGKSPFRGKRAVRLGALYIPSFTWRPAGFSPVCRGTRRGGEKGQTHLAGRGWRPRRLLPALPPMGEGVGSPAPPRPPPSSLHADRPGSPAPTPSSSPDPTLLSFGSQTETRYLQSGSTVLQVVLHGEARGVPLPLGEER